MVDCWTEAEPLIRRRIEDVKAKLDAARWKMNGA